MLDEPQDEPQDELEDESEPGAAEGHGRRFMFIGIGAGVLVVVVALLTWFVFVPMTRPSATPPTPTESLTEQTPAQTSTPEESTGTGVPDLLTQPASWSPGIPLPGSDDLSYSDVIETGIGSIVVIDSLSELYAVDLAANDVVWSLAGYSYWITLDDGTGIVSDDASGQIAKVNVQTGQLDVVGTLPSGYDIEYLNADVVVTDSINEGTYCARPMTALDTCLWQASDDIVWGTRVFGNGRWFSTVDGVFDLTTGQPASFGKDSVVDETSVSAVYYDGPDGGVQRFDTDSNNNTVLQLWDTQNNQALSSPTPITGWVDPDTYDAPLIYAHGQTTDSEYRLSAYSWQTGQLVWWASPKLVEGDPGLWLFGNYIQVWMDAQDKPAHPDRPASAIINSQGGQILWQGDDMMVAMAGQRVVYVGSDQPYTCGSTLDAYDGQASGLPQLWSVDAPEDEVQFQGVASRVIALSCSSGQMWVLQP